MEQEYEIMYNKMLKQEISFQEFSDYCTSILDQLLEKNQDVLKNLKDA